MVNYNQGKIYRIEPISLGVTGDIYIGSTTKKLLSQRMSHHRNMFRNNTKPLSAFKLFEKYGSENLRIVLIELYPCGSKDELESREAFYIKNNKCVNKKIPLQTRAEYREKNKSKKALMDKKYYNKNKHEIISKRQNQKVTCECGCDVLKCNLNSHKKTKRHQTTLAKVQIKLI